jgi:hypothetical protein
VRSAIRSGCSGLVSPEVSCHRAGVKRITEVWVSWKRVLRTRIPTDSGWSEAWLLVGHGVGRDRSGTEAACAEA